MTPRHYYSALVTLSHSQFSFYIFLSLFFVFRFSSTSNIRTQRTSRHCVVQGQAGPLTTDSQYHKSHPGSHIISDLPSPSSLLTPCTTNASPGPSQACPQFLVLSRPSTFLSIESLRITSSSPFQTLFLTTVNSQQTETSIYSHLSGISERGLDARLPLPRHFESHT